MDFVFVKIVFIRFYTHALAQATYLLFIFTCWRNSCRCVRLCVCQCFCGQEILRCLQKITLCLSPGVCSQQTDVASVSEWNEIVRRRWCSWKTLQAHFLSAWLSSWGAERWCSVPAHPPCFQGFTGAGMRTYSHTHKVTLSLLQCIIWSQHKGGRQTGNASYFFFLFSLLIFPLYLPPCPCCAFETCYSPYLLVAGWLFLLCRVCVCTSACLSFWLALPSLPFDLVGSSPEFHSDAGWLFSAY